MTAIHGKTGPGGKSRKMAIYVANHAKQDNLQNFSLGGVTT